MKNSKIMKRSLAALGLAGLLATTAVAASTVTTKMIEANYMGIKIVVDGVAVTPKDANGKVVEPFASEGTTYLPVRAIGEALGKEVTWDGATSTVYVGQVPGQETNWMKELPPYQTNHDTDLYDGSDPHEFFTVSGIDHTAGVVLQDAYTQEGYALWNTSMKYDTMTFTVGHVDGTDERDATLSIYLDGEYVTEYDLAFNGNTQTITVPLDRAATVEIRLDAYKTKDNGEKVWDNIMSDYGIFDISFS